MEALARYFHGMGFSTGTRAHHLKIIPGYRHKPVCGCGSDAGCRMPHDDSQARFNQASRAVEHQAYQNFEAMMNKFKEERADCLSVRPPIRKPPSSGNTDNVGSAGKRPPPGPSSGGSPAESKRGRRSEDQSKASGGAAPASSTRPSPRSNQNEQRRRQAGSGLNLWDEKTEEVSAACADPDCQRPREYALGCDWDRCCKRGAATR